MSLGFYVNNKGCYGCKTCTAACVTTKLPGNRTTFMRRVTDILTDKPMTYAFLSLSCNHCESPACLANCPQGAYTKLENGIVVQDHDACIGCQTCINACPYGAPAYDEAEKKVYKCDMCKDRLEAGKTPACVEACPGAFLACGELDDLKAAHPDCVQEIPDVTPSASETGPSLLIELDSTLR